MRPLAFVTCAILLCLLLVGGGQVDWLTLGPRPSGLDAWAVNDMVARTSTRFSTQ